MIKNKKERLSNNHSPITNNQLPITASRGMEVKMNRFISIGIALATLVIIFSCRSEIKA